MLIKFLAVLCLLVVCFTCSVCKYSHFEENSSVLLYNFSHPKMGLCNSSVVVGYLGPEPEPRAVRRARARDPIWGASAPCWSTPVRSWHSEVLPSSTSVEASSLASMEVEFNGASERQ